MEPDLDRLLDFESGGGLFPQFETSWKNEFAAAAEWVDRSLGGAVTRPRIALKLVDPQAFSALFLAFCRHEVDLYLFNPTWGRGELDTAMRIARPHALIGEFRSGSFASEPVPMGVPGGERIEMGANKLRVMIPTGGTTGRIRFAIHDWSSLAAATYGFQQHMNCAGMAAHCVLPLYHVSGFMQLVRALLTVGKIAFGRLESFEETHRCLLSVPHGNRFLSLVSTQLERVMRDEAKRDLLRSYSAIFVGGGPAPVGLLEDCREKGIPLAPTYGMTETAAQVATLLPSQFLKGELSQGKPLPHARIDIVAEESPSERVAPGEIGRIRIGGGSLFRGYAGEDPSKREPAIVTSDLGRFDQQGNLTVLGRIDRVIISGGEKVNLRQIELAVEGTDLVRDAVAFGMDDVEWGQKLALAYVPKAAFVTEKAIRESLMKELASFKIPKVWIRLERIPRNEAGKPILADLQSSAAS
ncbi:AMP-binding protein [Pelagicoccus sp. SDUM812003]|uniref:AMP-binding protein n=1 Tax=Pelagicoccus sp. SDUM812003 TaxID=3041267 RepID=UPI00280F1F0A|nr:AMP-binding protein [Pelagicoccus sp. SDUM812003]MDQ8203259.1 AMP-binding protein [Pelagicoccus sp. SDUM812003]